MEKDILSIITNGLSGFSKGQKLISNYIMSNYDKAAFMTAGRLGNAVGVSESTVVRFATELGYDGYPEMRRALQELIRNRLTSVQRIEVARDRMGERDVLKAVLTSDLESLRAAIEEIDGATFGEAVRGILAASRVYILGTRSSAGLAGFLAYYLDFILDGVCFVGDKAASEVFEQLRNISKDDLFIGVSFPRYARRTMEAMRFAGSMGAKTIAITDSEGSPFSEIADISLHVRSDMVSFLDSLVAPQSLINALIVAVGAQKRDALDETFKRLERIWDEFGVYEKSGI